MTEFAFELKPAKKESVPPLIGLWGRSGSGKTYSAILLARGLVGPKGKIAVIDTENGRAKFYADIAGGWLHLDMQPPFSPEKYSAAFKYCEAQGADVIVVDSMSHVWENVLETADTSTLKGLAKWKSPKIAHKRMMNDLIRSPIPVIFCIRAKEASKQVGSGSDMKIIQLGWQPVTERNFTFEMTVDLNMTKDGYYDLNASKTVPEALRGVIKQDGRVDINMGALIAEWAGSGVAIDPAIINLKREGQESALGGVETYTKWLAGLSAEKKATIKHLHSGWSKEAKEADAIKPQEEGVV